MQTITPCLWFDTEAEEAAVFYTSPFQLDCADQAEVDRYWEGLAKGGEEGPCGWLKDRYGLSWQVIPRRLMELVNGPDPEGAQRATQAMLATHGKLDVATLEKAYAGT